MINTTAYISASGTTNAVPSGASVVHTVVIPAATSNTITFQSTAATPVVYFVLPASTVAGSYVFDAVCGNGLDIVAAGNDTAIVTIGV